MINKIIVLFFLRKYKYDYELLGDRFQISILRFIIFILNNKYSDHMCTNELIRIS